MSRKIVKSQDVVFLEDQLVDGGDKVKKLVPLLKFQLELIQLFHL